jgi:hypothetical protein
MMSLSPPAMIGLLAERIGYGRNDPARRRAYLTSAANMAPAPRNIAAKTKGGSLLHRRCIRPRRRG